MGLDFKCMHTLRGHTGYVSTVTVSPDGSLCASGGKDGIAKLWDLNRGESLYELACGEVINQLAFSPNRYWLCAATEKMIHIWTWRPRRRSPSSPRRRLRATRARPLRLRAGRRAHEQRGLVRHGCVRLARQLGCVVDRELVA